MKKILALLLVAVMILGIFTACGSKTDSDNTPTENDGNHMQTPVVGGTLTIYAAAALKVSYDTEGLVLEVEGLNKDGEELMSYYTEDVYGTSCTDMVNQLIKDCLKNNYMFDTKYVVVKQGKGSKLPGISFLESVQSAAQRALDSVESEATLVLITEENLNADGYIDLVTAELLVKKYLGVEKLDLFDGTINPVDGMYSFEVSYGIISDRVVVNAETGAVSQGMIEELEQAEDLEEMATAPTHETIPAETESQEVQEPKGTVAEEE